jgi:hypothetical protein
MTNYKSGGLKGCSDTWDAVIAQIGAMSHHLLLFLSAIEFTISCVHSFAK